MKKYAVIENTIVTNVVVAEPDYAAKQGWIEITGQVSPGWLYINGQFTKPIEPEEKIKENNKKTATQLLQETDWTATIDISNPQYSNSYLMNQNEFLEYRSQVRQIAINPPTTPAEFPNRPTEIWSQ